MKKLLLLALLGLGLGGGVWKAQNPDGTLDDLTQQASGVALRLQSGVDTVISHPGSQSATAVLEDRLSLLETAAATDDNVDQTTRVEAMVDERLAENAGELMNLQETLEQRVAPMESMTVAVAELDNALQETRARTDAGNVRIDAIDRRLELLVRRLDEQTTEEQMQGVLDNLQQTQARIDDLQSELASQKTDFTDTLEQIVEQADILGLRLATLAIAPDNATLDADATGREPLDSDPLVEADSDARTARDNVPATQTENRPPIQSLSATIDERLSGIEQRLATVNPDSRRIDTLSVELEAAREKIALLEQQDTEAMQSLSELNTSVDALATVSESLTIDAIQAQIRDQLALAQSQFDNSETRSDTSQLESLLDVTRNRIQTLEQRVQNLPASSSEAGEALEIQSALQSQIAELEQRLEQLTSTDPALANTVNDVKQQVEQLSAKGFVTQDELRAQTEAESIEYKIYFDRNSAEVTEDAAGVLNSFITQEKNRTTGVSIFGFTDRSGSAAYNQQLALQRATNVRSFLIQNGIDFTKIKALSGLGEDAAAAVLPDDASDSQQRVVVLYAAQP